MVFKRNPKESRLVRYMKRKPKLTKKDKAKLERLDWQCNCVSISSANACGTPISGGVGADFYSAHLSSIAQGAGPTQRLGSVVKPIRLKLDYQFYYSNNGAASTEHVDARFIVFQGTTLSAALPSFAALLQDASSDAVCLSSGFNNDLVDLKVDTSHKERNIRILYDTGIVQLKNGAAAAASVGTGTKQNMHIRKTFGRRRMREVLFNGAGNAAWLMTPILLIAFSNSVNATPNSQPILKGTATLWFDTVI